MTRWLLLGLLVATLVTLSPAEVERVEIAWTGSVLNGKEFGTVGAYEAVRGTIYFTADPVDSRDAVITDLKLAPRNEDDEVEYSADFYLLWPVHADRGNGSVIMEVVNRGNKLMLPFFNGAQRVPEPTEAAHFGDAFLMEQGYALLWVGWQFDVPDGDDRIRVNVPVARLADGGAIEGLVRSEILVNDRVLTHTLADRDHKAYPVSKPEDSRNVMTVRDSREGARRQVPRTAWRFARMESGEVVPDATRVWLEGGFEPHKIYEVVYVAENPPVAGLGMLALRDAALYLKYSEEALFGIQEKPFGRVYAFGVSQSARLLRTFLYHGLNEGAWSQRAFDGMLVHVGGGGRGSFNVRFAQPSRDGHPFSNMFYPTDIFPFTDHVQHDPESDQEDGLLRELGGELSSPESIEIPLAMQARADAGEGGKASPEYEEPNPSFIPRIFYTNSSYEYWGRAASLTHTRIDGKRDFNLHPNSRFYLFSGTQHGPAPWPPVYTEGRHLANPNDFHPGMRALLVRLDRWVKGEQEPPESRIPSIRKRSLVPPEKLNWPTIPNAPLLTGVQKAYRADYGARFRAEGIVEKEPPELGSAFPILVPKVDADGNEVAGVRLPAVAVPLATYTGWNPFRPQAGPETEISSMVGSFIPFPRTRDEARTSGDRRKPISDRYRSREDYLGRVNAAARQLVNEGFLLQRDVAGILERAGQQWDWVMQQP